MDGMKSQGYGPEYELMVRDAHVEALEQENARLRAIVEPLERLVRTGGVVEIQLRGDGEIWVNFDNSASLGVATTIAGALAKAATELEGPKE